MQAEKRIQEIYGELPSAPIPVASYVPVVRSGNTLYLSGQGPIINGRQMFTGKLGKQVSQDEGYEAAKLCGINLLAQLKKYLGDLDRVKRVLNARIYVASDPDFVNQPQVANGFSDLMVEVLGEKGRHSRCALGMPVLPGDIPVEAEITVAIED